MGNKWFLTVMPDGWYLCKQLASGVYKHGPMSKQAAETGVAILNEVASRPRPSLTPSDRIKALEDILREGIERTDGEEESGWLHGTDQTVYEPSIFVSDIGEDWVKRAREILGDTK